MLITFRNCRLFSSFMSFQNFNTLVYHCNIIWLGKQILSYSKLGIHIKSAYFSCQDVIHFLRQLEKMVIRGANFSSKRSGKDILCTIFTISMNKMVVYISLKTFQKQFLFFIWINFHEWWASKICLPEIPKEM